MEPGLHLQYGMWAYPSLLTGRWAPQGPAAAPLRPHKAPLFFRSAPHRPCTGPTRPRWAPAVIPYWPCTGPAVQCWSVQVARKAPLRPRWSPLWSRTGQHRTLTNFPRIRGLLGLTACTLLDIFKYS